MTKRKNADNADISGGVATDPGDEQQQEGAPAGGVAVSGTPAVLPSDEDDEGAQTGGPDITAGAGGPADSNKQGESMTANKGPAGEPVAEPPPHFAPIADARARLKKERGMSDAQVLSMNDDAVHKALAEIDHVQAQRNREQQRAKERNADHQNRRPGTPEGVPPTIGDSGYNRKDRNKG